MIATVLAEYPALKDLIAHVVRCEFPDAPCSVTHHRKLLARIGYWVEIALLTDIALRTDTAEPDESLLASDSETLDDESFLDDESEALVTLVSEEVDAHLRELMPLAEVLSITPIDADGTAVVVLKPPTHNTKRSHP